MSRPGTEILVFNPIVFDSTASHLAFDAVVAYLQTVAAQGKALLRALREADASMGTKDELADGAAIEATLQAMPDLSEIAANAAVLADALGAAIEAILQAMPDLSEKNQTGGCS